MGKHERAKNQDYAIAFENEVANILGAKNRISNSIVLPQNERDVLKGHAICVAHHIQGLFGTDTDYIYCGRQTSNALGDFMTSDGKSIELKYVYGNTSGTYHNTSIDYFQSLCMFSYHNWLEHFGYMEWLQSVIPDDIDINCNANSPLKYSDASKLRNEYPSIARLISNHELPIRRLYTSYVSTYIDAFSLEGIVISDMINKKKTSDGQYKGISDVIVVCNSKTGDIRTIDKDDLIAKTSDNYKMHVTDTSIVFDGLMRLAIGWQNGNGMNNPTIRAFLI